MVRIKQIDFSDIPAITGFCAGMSTEPAEREGRKLRKYWLENNIGRKDEEDKSVFRVYAAIEEKLVRELDWPGEGKVLADDLAHIDGKLVTGILECSTASVTPEPLSDGDYWVLRCLWVIPPYAGRGIGGELMRRFVNGARENSRGAAVLAQSGSSPFDSYKAMPDAFFRKYGLVPIAKEGDNALLFMDFGIGEDPVILPPNDAELGKADIELFWVNTCPVLNWSAANIRERMKNYPGLTFRSIEIKDRDDVLKFGMSNGLAVKSEIVRRRFIFWSDVEEHIVKFGYERYDG